jgi:hypothetical protein
MADDTADLQRLITARSIPLQRTIESVLERDLADLTVAEGRCVAEHATREIHARLVASDVREHPALLPNALKVFDDLKAFVVEAAWAGEAEAGGAGPDTVKH